MNTKFDEEPVYNFRFIKPKLDPYNTKFYGGQMP